MFTKVKDTFEEFARFVRLCFIVLGIVFNIINTYGVKRAKLINMFKIDVRTGDYNLFMIILCFH